MDFDKLAESFTGASRLLSEDERLVLASAVEVVVLEKEAGSLPGNLTEEDIILVAAAVADTLLKE